MDSRLRQLRVDTRLESFPHEWQTAEYVKGKVQNTMITLAAELLKKLFEHDKISVVTVADMTIASFVLDVYVPGKPMYSLEDWLRGQHPDKK